jgi:hypothetical protein
MVGRHKLLILIPAIILIPILLGMTPLNMAHRLASGGTLAQGKQVCWSNYCPFHSIASHDNQILANVSLATVYEVSPSTQEFRIPLLDSVHSNTFFNSAPLRC